MKKDDTTQPKEKFKDNHQNNFIMPRWLSSEYCPTACSLRIMHAGIHLVCLETPVESHTPTQDVVYVQIGPIYMWRIKHIYSMKQRLRIMKLQAKYIPIIAVHR
mmetsp:Transcript_17798/g.37147  ORF Transcript_17798/g.37147 Transcript_17798/m.37147 type:complete len:104 (-) Transcript_17798:46-357(-)